MGCEGFLATPPKIKGFLAKKLSSSIDNQIDNIANTLEERAQWQKFGL